MQASCCTLTTRCAHVSWRLQSASTAYFTAVREPSTSQFLCLNLCLLLPPPSSLQRLLCFRRSRLLLCRGARALM
jgi:hypothetical protein